MVYLGLKTHGLAPFILFTLATAAGLTPAREITKGFLGGVYNIRLSDKEHKEKTKGGIV